MLQFYLARSEPWQYEQRPPCRADDASCNSISLGPNLGSEAGGVGELRHDREHVAILSPLFRTLAVQGRCSWCGPWLRCNSVSLAGSPERWQFFPSRASSTQEQRSCNLVPSFRTWQPPPGGNLAIAGQLQSSPPHSERWQYDLRVRPGGPDSVAILSPAKRCISKRPSPMLQSCPPHSERGQAGHAVTRQNHVRCSRHFRRTTKLSKTGGGSPATCHGNPFLAKRNRH